MLGGKSRLGEVNGGEKETDVILPTVKNFLKKKELKARYKEKTKQNKKGEIWMGQIIEMSHM